MKRYVLVLVSVFFIIRAVFLNVFSPVSSLNNKTEDTLFLELKNGFSSQVSNYISDDVSGLSKGYLLGMKSELPDGLEQKMKTVGMAHIIVVSGTHLSIIVACFRKVFGKVSRLFALYFSILFLLIYVLMVGVSPSLVRASFVAILSLFAWYFGREQKPERTVIYTLGFCLFLNPYFLTNLSFQLSMLAYIGILLILPGLIHYFYGPKKPKLVGSTVLATLSAMLACLPIQIYYFGSFSIISILANVLILPTISIVMGLSFLTGLFGLFGANFIASGFGLASEMILKYHVFIISSLYERTEYVFEFGNNNPLVLLLYVFVFGLVFLMIFLKKHRRKKRLEAFLNLDNVKIFD